MIDSNLLHRFLANKCSAEEADFVVKYLNDHPETLECLLPEADWEELLEQQEFEQKRVTQLKVRRTKAVRWLYRAAAVLLIIGTTAFLQHRFNERKALIAVQNQNKQEMLDKTKATYVVRRNNREQALTIAMEDGSEVVLEPKSEVTFAEKFVLNRLINLKGKARFTVAKDSLHPFRVVAEGVETTALGTSFSVDALAGSKKVSVELLSGSVSIHSKGTEEKIILRPGDRYTLTPNGFEVTHPYARKVTPSKKKVLEARQKVLIKGDSLIFEKLPLAEVLSVLSKSFATDIEFDKETLQKSFYTGYIVKSKPLMPELKKIALMNGLQLTADSLENRFALK